MRGYISLIFILCFYSMSPNYGQMTAVEKGLQSITQDAIKAQLGYLASDWMEGREAGEKGEFMASDYIASMLQLYGVKPGGDYLRNMAPGNKNAENERSYFQNIILLKTIAGDEQILKIRTSDDRLEKSTDFTPDVDFFIIPSDPNIEIEAPVVFVGYGFKNEKFQYNDFNKLDVKGKFILKINGIPKFIKDTLTPEEISSYLDEMESAYKTMGVIGILGYNPDTRVVGWPVEKDFMNMSPSEGRANRGKIPARFSIPGKKTPDNLIRISVAERTANEILKGTGINPEDYIKKADTNSKYLISPLSGKEIYLKTSVKTSQVAVRNVLGLIEGKNPEKFIVLGAHYDHIGSGNGYIWNGADDNGSGTVGVMTLARAIMATGEKPENTIIFALWTAEEEGLLGSRYYVRNLAFPVKNLILNVNFDMISRYISENDPKKVTLTYTSSYPLFRDITVSNLEKYGIDLLVDYQPSADPPGGTDHRSFVEAGVPIMRFKPGHREEYHTPGDESKTVDWDIMEKIIKISFTDVWELANSKW